jgi:DNA-binding transcriptional regulator YiaG
VAAAASRLADLSTAAGLTRFGVSHQLTQRELAAVLGVDITAVQRWEAGARAISAPVARLLLLLERDPAALALLRKLV